MNKAADKAGDKGTLPKFLMALKVLPSTSPKPQQQHKTLHHGYCPGVYIIQAAQSLPGLILTGDSGWGHTASLLKSSQKALSSLSPQSNSLLPSIKFFPLCKYAGKSWHHYLCSYMVTRIGELIWVKNNSTKEKVLFLTQLSSPAQF